MLLPLAPFALIIVARTASLFVVRMMGLRANCHLAPLPSSPVEKAGHLDQAASHHPCLKPGSGSNLTRAFIVLSSLLTASKLSYTIVFIRYRVRSGA